MKPKKNSTSSKKTKVFKTVKPGVEIAYLTSKQMNTQPASYFSHQLLPSLVEENIYDCLKQMAYSFIWFIMAAIYLIIYFLMGFIPNTILAWVAILGVFFNALLEVISFFKHKNVIRNVVKAFFEKYTTPPTK